ncbi:MAG TPA: glycosyltransferase family 1 protein [Patescibacteria group bacterium]|nr:glycosyltransferase family 1 protein [Patescibacteria group bacterium]
MARIAIDARMMGAGETRGIGRYIEELIRGLLSLNHDHTFVLFERHPEVSPFLEAKRVEHIQADIPWYGLAEQTRLPSIIQSANADLVHFPHWNVPFWFHGKSVLTIHDLLLRHEPASAKISTRGPFVRTIKRFGYRMLLRRAIDHAKAILVPTEFVRQDVINHYRLTEQKISITSEGITALPAPDFARVPNHPFIFYIGSAYPHKRLDLLLDAWRALSTRSPERELVIAGEHDVFLKKLISRVQRESLPRVSFPGRLSDAELAGFLQKAEVFVFPSAHEGFGLPPLEALAQGCPVISSDAPSLKEILPNEGVFFFRSNDKNAMIQAFDTVFSAPLKAKESVRRVQSFILEQFSWKEAAARTLEAYERVIHA